MQQRPAALLRLLRGLPQRAGHDDHGHGADRAGTAGRLLRHGDAAHQLRRRRRADSRATRFPQAAINPVSRNVVNLYPLGNVSPSIYRATLVGNNVLDQAGGRLDFNVSPNDQIFGRYSYSGGHNINPISVRGTDVPGFPTRDDLSTHAATLSSTHIFSPSLTNSAARDVSAARLLLRPAPQPDAAERARLRLRLVERGGSGPAVLQHQRLHADRRRDHRTAKHDAEHLRGAGRPDVDRGVAPGQGRRRDQAHRHRHVPGDRAQRIFRFRRDVPDQQRDGEPAAGRSGHVLPGTRRLRPSGQRLGARRCTRRTSGALGPRAHVELRPALRADQPLHRSRGPPERLRPGREVDGQAGRAGRARCFRAIPASARGIADSANAFMPRAGVAWDPTGRGLWSVRASYGLFYDQFQNGVGHGIPGGDQRDAVGAVQSVQRRGSQLPEPVSRGAHCRRRTRSSGRRPSSRSTPRRRPPSVQNWNVERAAVAPRAATSSKSAMSARRERTSRATSRPTRRSTAPARRRRMPTAGACMPTALPTAAPATSRRSRCCGTSRSRRITRARRASRGGFGGGIGFNVSYWYSRTLRLSVGDEPLRRRGQAARRRERPGAEPVRSGRGVRSVALRRASPLRRQRELEAHASPNSAPAAVRAIFGGWQLNGIATHNSGTPFTVSDSANVALQANSPPISGFPASRPDLVGDPNGGPRTVDEWLSRSAFRAPEHSDRGRTVRKRRPEHRARTVVHERRHVARARLSACAARHGCSSARKSFNVANHPNFGLPVADLNSVNFGRIFSAAAPRLLQFGLKLIF